MQSITNDEIRLIKDGEFIPCIRSIRIRTGMGLKEAKELAEYWRDRIRMGTFSIFRAEIDEILEL